ncbi:hypothetical protein Peur_065304 [Populus x canadensis]
MTQWDSGEFGSTGEIGSVEEFGSVDKIGSRVGSWLVRTCQCSCGSFGSSYRQFAAVSYMGKKLAEHGIMGAPAVLEVRGSLYL